MLTVLRIDDIIRLKRVNYKSTTTQKSCFVISYRLSGESCFLYNNKTITVKPGEILFIPRGCSYSQNTEQEEIICIHLDALSPKFNHLQKVSVDSPDEVRRLFIKCHDIYSKREKNFEYRCMAILYEILSHIQLNEADKKETPFDIAIQYLETNIYSSDFCIEKLCRRVNISRTYFNRLFKQSIGIAPAEYINIQRIKKAKFLIESGDYTNEEIAFLCGFNDVKYFYVIFKKYTGTTTLVYKRSLKDL